MFMQFHTRLRSAGLPTGVKEWMGLLEALSKHAIPPDFTAFYQISRSILCKDETDFQAFDRAFLETFKNHVSESDILEEILENMADGKEPLMPTDELLTQLKELGFDEVLANFFEQLKEEHYKKHQGGSKAIGKYGKSTQGADGYNKAGVRIGQKEGRHGRAIQIAEWRRFHAYQNDKILNTRDMQAALRLLKKALPVGPKNELDLEASIAASARDAGEIHLEFTQQLKPTARVILLLDVGGSMDPYAELVSTLFSAAKSQLKDLQTFYFHNCVYQEVWEDAERRRPVSTQKICEKYGQDHWLIVCGDAAMSPYELMHKNGAIDLWYDNEQAGIQWLSQLQSDFVRSLWLNPEPQRTWEWTFTVQQIAAVFRMEPLTLEGLKEGVSYLRKTTLPTRV